MCGRTTLYLDAEDIAYSLGNPEWIGNTNFNTSYNVTPSYYQPVILHSKAAENLFRNNKSVLVEKNMEPKEALTEVEVKEEVKDLGSNIKLTSMKWGLVPSYSSHIKPSNIIMPINIRDDSLTTDKPMFKKLKQYQRCLVVAQGFYEWKRSGKGKTAAKVPYYSHLPNNSENPLMLIGALYDVCHVLNETVYSYALVTTKANDAFKHIHDRMPLIFDPVSDQVEIMKWISPSIPFNDNIKDFLHPYSGALVTYQVSDGVNNSRNDSEEFIVPVAEITTKTPPKKAAPGQTTLHSFFSKVPKDESLSKTKRENSPDATSSFPANKTQKVKEEEETVTTENFKDDYISPYFKKNASEASDIKKDE